MTSLEACDGIERRVALNCLCAGRRLQFTHAIHPASLKSPVDGYLERSHLSSCALEYGTSGVSMQVLWLIRLWAAVGPR